MNMKHMLDIIDEQIERVAKAELKSITELREQAETLLTLIQFRCRWH